MREFPSTTGRYISNVNCLRNDIIPIYSQNPIIQVECSNPDFSTKVIMYREFNKRNALQIIIYRKETKKKKRKPDPYTNGKNKKPTGEVFKPSTNRISKNPNPLSIYIANSPKRSQFNHQKKSKKMDPTYIAQTLET